VSFRDFRGFAQLQCHRYDRSSTAALSDVADRDSRSGPSANCLGIEADAFSDRPPRDVASSSSVGGIRCRTNMPACMADGDHRASEHAGRAVERCGCRTY